MRFEVIGRYLVATVIFLVAVGVAIWAFSTDIKGFIGLQQAEQRLRVEIAIAAMMAVTLSGTLAAGRQIWPPSLSVADLVSMRLVEMESPGAGRAVLTQFHEWRQDQWRQLARGMATTAVALLGSVLALVAEASKVLTETTNTGATVTTVVNVDPFAVAEGAFVAGLLFVGALFSWSRGRESHSEFVRGLGSFAP